jgi:valyl-tRNA synthetase
MDNNRIITPGAPGQQDNAQTPGPFVMMQQMQQTIVQQIQQIGGFMKHLEQGLIALSQEVQAQALGARMLMDVLVEKNVCTKEEMEKYYKEKVHDKFKQQIEEMQKKVQQAAAAQQEAAEQAAQAEVVNCAPQEHVEQKKSKDAEEKNQEENVEENSADVVLASERFQNEDSND